MGARHICLFVHFNSSTNRDHKHILHINNKTRLTVNVIEQTVTKKHTTNNLNKGSLWPLPEVVITLYGFV